MRIIRFALSVLFYGIAWGQTPPPHEPLSPVEPAKVEPAKKDEPPKWYDKISARGYLQFRYNRLLETNDKLRCDQCDKSWGENGGFFLRRARLILSGQIAPRVYFYLQPDFASAVGPSSQNFAQLRDAYFDVGLDPKNEFRVRLGQSKVPFGFENLQSSQNRIPLDRVDALNSAVANERDLGVMLYWAPEKIRKRFAELVSSGLKGSGDYGVIGVGAYNGQTANRAELNDHPHVVARATYPIQIGGQTVEPGIMGYAGEYVLPADQIDPGNGANPDRQYADRRAGATFVLYPQPFGIQAEYNVGEGPEFSPAAAETREEFLHGGYATLSYRIKSGEAAFTPYSRYQYYDGGKKHELDARSYAVHEVETGLEWQPNKALELVAAYTWSRRRFEDAAKLDHRQEGRLLRLQAQLNY